jgi:chromosome segregation ATPase
MNSVLSSYFTSANANKLPRSSNPNSVPIFIYEDPTEKSHEEENLQVNEDMEELDGVIQALNEKPKYSPQQQQQPTTKIADSVQIQTLTGEVTLYKSQYNTLKNENKELKTQNQVLSDKLELFETELNATQTELKKQKERVQDLKKSIGLMNSTHPHEIRILQKYIQQDSRFSLSDTSELIERLGVLALQREQYIKEKEKALAEAAESRDQLYAMVSELTRLKRERTKLLSSNEFLHRANKAMIEGVPQPNSARTDDSSVFDSKLVSIERRYAVYRTGAGGTETHLEAVEDKMRDMSAKMNIIEADNLALRRDVIQWKKDITEKDLKIQELSTNNKHLDERLLVSTQTEQEALQKSQLLESQLSTLKLDFMKFKEKYQGEVNDELESPRIVVKETVDSLLEFQGIELEITDPIQILCRTGEIVDVSIMKYENSGKFAVKCIKLSTQEILYLPLTQSKVNEALDGGSSSEDDEHSWHDILYSIGFNSQGFLVFPEIVMDETREISSIKFGIKLMKYDYNKFYLSAFDEEQQRLCDLRVHLRNQEETELAIDHPEWIINNVRCEIKGSAIQLRFEHD